jgi:hypothetical protein
MQELELMQPLMHPTLPLSAPGAAIAPSPLAHVGQLTISCMVVVLTARRTVLHGRPVLAIDRSVTLQLVHSHPW